MSKDHSSGFTLIELMVVVAIIGILAAIAIPTFMKFQYRSKQAEVKSNLKCLFVAEKSYFPENDTYTDSIQAVGFQPERGNRYSYILNTPSTYLPRNVVNPALLPTMNAIEVDTFEYSYLAAEPAAVLSANVATGSTGSFMAVAVGNIDPTSVLDEWSVASITRSGATTSSGTTCAAGNNASGEPCQDQGTI
jgi:type IV pilus assembly protein PilA